MEALLYLLTRQWKGAVINLMRSGARILVGLLGAAYIFYIIGNSLLFFTTMQEHGSSLHATVPLTYLRGGLLFMLALPGYAIVLKGLQGDLVTFTAADIDFLFAMPLPQRRVLGFRLALDSLRMLGYILLGVLWAGPIFAGLMGVPVGAVLVRAVPALFLCFLFLASGSHAVYILYSYRVKGLGWLSTAVKAVGVAALIALALILGNEAARGHTAWQQAALIFNHPIVRALMLPVSLAVDAMMSAHPGFPGSFGTDVLVLGVMALAGVGAMLGQRENIYEPSIPASLRRSRLREAMRSGGIPALRLELLRERTARRAGRGAAAPYLGGGWRALVWKNLQIWLRSPWLGLILGLFAALGIPLLLWRFLTDADRGLIQGAPFVWLYFLWIIGVSVLQQTRNELAQGAFLKAAPIPGWQVVMALILLPTAGFTIALWSFLLMCGLLFEDVAQPALWPAALVGPPMMAALAIFHALVAILYPRHRDPLHRLLSGILMLPGWGLLIVAPLVLAGTVISLLVPHGLAELASPGMTITDADRLTVVVAAVLCAVYCGVCALLVWLAGMAFRAYSPAEE